MAKDLDNTTTTKADLFRLWGESLEYRECGPATWQTDNAFRTTLKEVLAGRTHILDLACGDGNNLPYLPADSVVTACECSPLALARLQARDDHPPMRKLPCRTDVSRLPVASATQDAVVSSYSFEHFLDVPGILDECDRVLKPGGLLVVFGPDFRYPNNFAPPQHPRLARDRVALVGYALGRLLRQARLGRSADSVLFEYVEPLPDTGQKFIPDQDLTYLTNHATLAKYLAARGYDLVSLERSARPAKSPLHRLAARLGFWGSSGDARVIVRKPTAPGVPRRLRVTERLIHRQSGH